MTRNEENKNRTLFKFKMYGWKKEPFAGMPEDFGSKPHRRGGSWLSLEENLLAAFVSKKGDWLITSFDYPGGAGPRGTYSNAYSSIELEFILSILQIALAKKTFKLTRELADHLRATRLRATRPVGKKGR